MSRPLDFFRYHRGQLSAAGTPLSRIASKVGTPCYVYSEEGLLEPLREFQRGLARIDSLICFAAKANSSLAVLRLLGRHGAGLDLVSGGELYRAARAGVPAERLVFSGVGKTPEEMAAALGLGGGGGIFSFNVESVAELECLSRVASRRRARARVALRFNPDVDARTHPYISTGLKKNKFGLNRGEILGVARALERFPGIDFRGVSLHIGSQLLSLAPLEDAFKRTRALLAELDRLLPEPLSFVDLGGGLGVTYEREKAPPIARYCALIRKHFGPGSGGPKRRVLIEPGRAISANAGVLLTSVLYRKGRGSKDFLIVDAAMNDLLRPALYGSYHDVVPTHLRPGERMRKTDVVGPVCESADCLASGRSLPASLGQGDLLALLSAGAYGFTLASNYNSRPRPAEVLVAPSGKFRLIRKRESLADLVRGE